MFVPAPVEVNLPPRSGGEAFDGIWVVRSTSTTRCFTISLRTGGILFPEAYVAADEKEHFFDQKEQTLELNQKINTAMNNLKFCHFL